jgi:undecaprenyl pyrophosphate phosphatase UppP
MEFIQTHILLIVIVAGAVVALPVCIIYRKRIFDLIDRILAQELDAMDEDSAPEDNTDENKTG